MIQNKFFQGILPIPTYETFDSYENKVFCLWNK
jgi:hypothetical protein